MIPHNKKHGKFHGATEKVWHTDFREKGEEKKKWGVEVDVHHSAVEYVHGLIAT